MKKLPVTFATVLLCFGFVTARAQMGGPGGGPPRPDFSGAMAKLFGDNTAFTATAEMRAKNEQTGEDMVMPGKLAYNDGKSRFEMDLSQMKGSKLPPGAAAQMKQLGMDILVSISLPDKKTITLLYPELQACVEMPLPNAGAAKSPADFDLKISELGKESLAGHACVKNKVMVTEKDGKTQEYTVWNASDLKRFPVQIETVEREMNVTIRFQDVKFDRPAAGEFETPASFKKYESMMALMQQEIMKRMSGGAAPSP